MHYNREVQQSEQFEPDAETVRMVHQKVKEIRSRLSSRITDQLMVNTSVGATPQGFQIGIGIYNANTGQQSLTTIMLTPDENNPNPDIEEGLPEDFIEQMVTASMQEVITDFIPDHCGPAS